MYKLLISTFALLAFTISVGYTIFSYSNFINFKQLQSEPAPLERINNNNIIEEEIPLFSCFGKSGKSSCSGFGQCAGPDKCLCNIGRAGLECEFSKDQCTTSRIQHAIFSHNFEEISISFSSPLHVLTNIEYACDSLFKNSKQFGYNAKCIFTTEQKLNIFLDKQTSFITQRELELIPRFLQSKGEICGLPVEDSEVKILVPQFGLLSTTPAPKASLRASSCIANCLSSYILDASYSTPSGLKFKYEMLQEGGYQFDQQIADQLANVSMSSSAATITKALPFGFSKFKLTVTDTTARSDTKELIVRRLNYAVPYVVIQAPNTYITTRNQKIALNSFINDPCSTSKNIDIQWSSTSHPGMNSKIKDPTSTTLGIEPFSLTPNVQYTFEVYAEFKDLSGNCSDQVIISIERSALHAELRGSSQMQLSNSAELVLDGSDSRDPDEEEGGKENLRYRFKCCKISGNSCNESECTNTDFPGLSTSNTSSIYRHTPQGANRFPLGKFEFSLEVSDPASGRVATPVKQTIEFVDTTPPTISFTKIPNFAFHPFERDLVIIAQVSHSTNPTFSYTWAVEESTLDLTDKDVSPSGPNLNYLHIAQKKLVDSVYKFKLTVTAGTLQGVSVVEIKVSQPPSSGKLTITPNEAISVQDKITLITSDWVSTSSLFYIYYEVNGNKYIPLTPSGPTTATTLTVDAPVVSTNKTVTYGVIAVTSTDGTGASSAIVTADVRINVLNYGSSVEQYAQTLISRFNETLKKTSIDSVTGAAKTVATFLSLSSDNSAQAVQTRTSIKKELINSLGNAIQNVPENSTIATNERVSLALNFETLLSNPNEVAPEVKPTIVNSITRITKPPKSGSLTEPLSSTGQSSMMNAISFAYQATGDKDSVKAILQSIKNLGVLGMASQPVGNSVQLSSSQFEFVQRRFSLSQAQSLSDFKVSNSATAPKISLSASTFSSVTDLTKLASIDVGIINFIGNNPYEYSNSVVNQTTKAVEFYILDAQSNQIQVSNLPANSPITFELYSTSLEKDNTTACRVFSVSEDKFVDDNNVKVVSVKKGESVKCSTTHLTSFAAFIKPDSTPENPPTIDPNLGYYWFLLLLLLIPCCGLFGLVAFGIFYFVVIAKKFGIADIQNFFRPKQGLRHTQHTQMEDLI